VCSSDLDGTMVKATRVNVNAAGDRTTLSLRPERVEIDPPKSMNNAVTGTVKELLYLGDHIRVRMMVAGDDEFIVKVRNRADKRPLKEGQKIKIGWNSGDCRALDLAS